MGCSTAFFFQAGEREENMPVSMDDFGKKKQLLSRDGRSPIRRTRDQKRDVGRSSQGFSP